MNEMMRAIEDMATKMEKLLGNSNGAPAKRCIALFDSGVDQLGAPRLAHLAVLVMLVRRAKAHQTQLEWCVFQQPTTTPLILGANQESISRLIRARSRLRISDSDIRRWTEFLAGLETTEVWLVGPECLKQQHSSNRTAIITLSDVIEPSSRKQIHVSASLWKGQHVKETNLEAPPDFIAEQMLRDPFSTVFASHTLTTERFDVGSSMLFSSNSERLYVRGSDLKLVALHTGHRPDHRPHLPPRAPVGYTAPEGHLYFAVGQSSDDGTLALSKKGSDLLLHRLSRRGSIQVNHFLAEDSETVHLNADTSTSPLRPLACFEDKNVVFMDDRGSVFDCSNGKYVRLNAVPAIAAIATTDSYLWAFLENGVPRLAWAKKTAFGKLQKGLVGLPAALPSIDASQGLFLVPGHFIRFAYAISPTKWLMVRRRGIKEIEVPDGFSVVGVFEGGIRSFPEAGLVAVDRDRTTIHLLFGSGRTKSFKTDERISRIEIGGSGWKIGLLTSTGKIFVYSEDLNRIFLRFKGRSDSARTGFWQRISTQVQHLQRQRESRRLLNDWKKKLALKKPPEWNKLDALGRELALVESTPETQALAKLIVRSLLGNAQTPKEHRLIQRFLNASGDGVLKVDVGACFSHDGFSTLSATSMLTLPP